VRFVVANTEGVTFVYVYPRRSNAPEFSVKPASIINIFGEETDGETTTVLG
jgi:hypothetical protein